MKILGGREVSFDGGVCWRGPNLSFLRGVSLSIGLYYVAVFLNLNVDVIFAAQFVS